MTRDKRACHRTLGIHLKSGVLQMRVMADRSRDHSCLSNFKKSMTVSTYTHLFTLEFVIHVELQAQNSEFRHLQVFNGEVEGGRRRGCAHGVRWIDETETR